MNSDRPKVLHNLGGRALLDHVLDRAAHLQAHQILVVIGHGGEQIKEHLADRPHIGFAHQVQQLGTGHAVMQALPLLDPEIERVLVLYGDVPLLPLSDLHALISSENLAILTTQLTDPTGYGRIVRDESGRIRRIVEHKDADTAIRTIQEINTGILCVPREDLCHYLGELRNDNSQNEYYLTDIVEMAVKQGKNVFSHNMQPAWAASGINNRRQQAELERHYQLQQAEFLLQQGVTLYDPQRIDLRGNVVVGKDVTLDIDIILAGQVNLADGVEIGPFCTLHNVRIGKNSKIYAHCVLENVIIGENVRIGPFARLRPGTELADQVHVGNFVEIKNTKIGHGSKANHLSYLGDAEIGEHVNVGAGTITCNYDGTHKHKTVIENGAFIGSNSALVAPVRIGARAVIGAGSVITKSVPAGMLALTRALQKMLPWRTP